MSMTAREKVMAVLAGEEPDKIPVLVQLGLKTGSPGGWMRRLEKRGLGFFDYIEPFKPEGFRPPLSIPHLEDIKYTQIHYLEKGLVQFREIIETPIGSITDVVRFPTPEARILTSGTHEEYFVKEPSDWRVINYIFKGMLDKLVPDYEALERREDELGDRGIALVMPPERTPYQEAWARLASLERTVIDFAEQPEELQEYIEIQRQLHTRVAEILAESPAKFINIGEHITNTISPKYYREYCIPFYEIYSKALEGTGKVLGTHIDGLAGHLKKEIREAPFKVFDSFTVPPVGDVSLTEAKSVWPDKILFVNTPPHLAWAKPEEIRKGYEALIEEWGSKKGLLIEHCEEMPLEKVEPHLSVVMDVFGY